MSHTDYEPLDLTAFCNATTAILAPSRVPTIGHQIYHGLPFRIGDGGDGNCFIKFEAEAPALTIPVDGPAFHVIFAHTMLDSRLHEGEPVARPIAHYTMVLQDGSRHECAIRERMEIAVVPITIASWFPLLALPDQSDHNTPRYEGKWADFGARQFEARQGIVQNYYLWPWRNPTPHVPIANITICPTGYMPFLVAGITLSHLDEEPFNRKASIPVEVTLREADDIAGPYALDVEVDRGVATYAYPIPGHTPEEFIEGKRPGWGEVKRTENSPAYVEIAASPSATVKVRKGDEELGSTNWGELTEKGTVETPRVHFEVVDTGRNWVHTTVLDDETGKPVPCRIHYRSPRGIPYAPHGHHAHVNSDMPLWFVDVGGDVRLGQISYAYIDGKCQGWMPRGEVLVDVARGFEYEPLRTKVHIAPGQRELTLRLKRNHHMNAQRYFSGDPHVHFLTTHGGLVEAAGEDLDVVNILLSQFGSHFANTEDFCGHPVVSRDGETIVYAAQENRQHMLGHLTLLGLKEPVFPMCTDGPGESEIGINLETTLSHWADACHAQGGTVIIPHLPNPNGEPAALIATGRADVVEMLRYDMFQHIEYYRYLNGGYKLPLVGGTDKMDNGVPVGLCRTYAYIPDDQPFNYDTWCNALKGGNTFLSSGPLLRFTVNGEPVGSTIALGKNGGTVEVEAVASSIFPINALEIIQAGNVVERVEETAGTRELRLKATLKIAGTTWLCARCAGPGYSAEKHFDSWQRGIMAHTSPIYLSCGGAYDLFSADTAHYMLTLINGSIEYLRQRAHQWEPGTVTHHHHHDDHQEYLEGPFHEAAAILHRKLHERGIPH